MLKKLGAWLNQWWEKPFLCKETSLTHQELAEKYGLAGRIAYKWPKAEGEGFTLIILLEKGKGPDVPFAFLEELNFLYPHFQVATTSAERFQEIIDDWIWYCDQFNEACG